MAKPQVKDDEQETETEEAPKRKKRKAKREKIDVGRNHSKRPQTIDGVHSKGVLKKRPEADSLFHKFGAEKNSRFTRENSGTARRNKA